MAKLSPRGRTARTYVGVRLPPKVVSAVDAAARVRGVSRTAVMEQWVSERAVAEGWMQDSQAEAEE
jgi:predicted transcriptional regulator